MAGMVGKVARAEGMGGDGTLTMRAHVPGGEQGFHPARRGKRHRHQDRQGHFGIRAYSAFRAVHPRSIGISSVRVSPGVLST